ncbi:MAG: transposase, partial [Anaerolineae bacterium]
GEASAVRTVHKDTLCVADASPLPHPHGIDSGSLGAIVGNFKSVSSRRINSVRHTPGGTVWQRNYYEHVIRNEESLNYAREYIMNNPAQWASD